MNNVDCQDANCLCKKASKVYDLSTDLKEIREFFLLHDELRPYKCSTCPLRFSTQAGCDSHVLKAHFNRTCSECGQVVLGRHAYSEHMKRHAAKEEFLCNVCGKVYYVRSTFNKHRQQHEYDKLGDGTTGPVNLHPPRPKVKDHSCKTCEEKFDKLVQLTRHIMEVHPELHTLKCEICDKAFLHRRNLIIHKRYHSGDFPYHCTVCQSSFVSRDRLRTHMPVHADPNSFSCEVCGKTFKYIGNLNRHKYKHTDKWRRFSCDQCSKTFTTNHQLKCHVHVHHLGLPNPSNQRPCQCEICGKNFHNLGTLSKHKKYRHTAEGMELCTCKICRKTCPSPSSLKMHMRGIHGHNVPADQEERIQRERIQCNKCPKSFTTRGGLNYHFKYQHTEEGKAKCTCTICGKHLVSPIVLKVHMRKHTGERHYSCENCGMRFALKSALQRHLQVHTGEKRFRCEYCSEAFIAKAQLQYHIRKHTGERPFSCEYCGKSFRDKTLLNNHVRQHTGEKPYHCDFCGKDFAQRSQLRRHLAKEHQYYQPKKAAMPTLPFYP